jgi:glutathione peroxidase
MKDPVTMRSLALKAFSLALLAVAPASVKAGGPQVGNAFDFNFTSIDGKPMPLSDYKGKVLVVVNTASFCGFTKQYTGLQKLYETYESKGLVVVGVPSNDFGGQEPGSSEKIKEFCDGNFGITFPMTEKNVVKGTDAHPFYKWAAATLGAKAAPGWNFHKYVVGRDGSLAQSFFSGAEPGSKEVIAAVEAELAKTAVTQ